MLLDAVDDLRRDFVPIESRRNGDSHLVDIEADTGHALDLVERQSRLNRGGVTSLMRYLSASAPGSES